MSHIPVIRPGNDGYIKYANFTVYVYKYKGKVLYMGAE